MKTTAAALMALTGLLTLLNSPASGQENKSPPTEDNPAARAADAPPAPVRPPPPRRNRGASPPAMQVPAPYIGVLTGPVPRELRAHFNLPEGFGLLVQEVMPDTPAQAAGLKVDDILLRFEDQKLVNMDQLQTLVRSKRKGDSVPMTVVSGGHETQVTVVIGERMMPREQEPGRFDGRMPLFDMERFGPDRLDHLRNTLERYEQQMEAYKDRFREWEREEGRGREQGRERGTGIVPTPPKSDWDRDLPDPDLDPRDGRPRADSRQRGTAHITRSDESGVYTLRKENGRSLFTARPKGGQERTWNVDNETERRSIPDAEREKLRQLEEIRGNEEGGSGL